MRCHLQKVMSKHWVIRDITKAKHGRLSEIDNEPGKNKRQQQQQQKKKRKGLHSVAGTKHRTFDSVSSTALRKYC